MLNPNSSILRNARLEVAAGADALKNPAPRLFKFSGRWGAELGEGGVGYMCMNRLKSRTAAQWH